MKKLLFTLLLFTSFIATYSQCVSYGYPYWEQPDELYRGRLKLPGMAYGNPYTLIDRRTYTDPQDAFNAIRSSLRDRNNQTLRDQYEAIYSVANSSARPAAGGGEDGKTSALAY